MYLTLSKEGVHVVIPAEYFPYPKATFICFCYGGNKPFVDLLLYKEDISAECIRGLRDASSKTGPVGSLD